MGVKPGWGGMGPALGSIGKGAGGGPGGKLDRGISGAVRQMGGLWDPDVRTGTEPGSAHRCPWLTSAHGPWSGSWHQCQQHPLQCPPPLHLPSRILLHPHPHAYTPCTATPPTLLCTPTPPASQPQNSSFCTPLTPPTSNFPPCTPNFPCTSPPHTLKALPTPNFSPLYPKPLTSYTPKSLPAPSPSQPPPRPPPLHPISYTQAPSSCT